MSTTDEIAARVTKRMIAQNINRQQLANAANMTWGQVDAICYALHTPTIPTLERLAQALGCQLRDLLP